MESKDSILRGIREALDTYLGYPCNSAYDYSELINCMSMHINNVGDPFYSSTYRANTKQLEREVLYWFAKLWGIKIDGMWGCITNGGTESSLQALYIARESAKDKPHVFLTSKDSHYSIFKIAKLLCLNLQIVESQESGEMDYQDLDRKVSENTDKYIIVNINMGTTMKGAIDSSSQVARIFKKYKVTDFYMHADAALTGFFLPFIEQDLCFKTQINSMSISLHKFMGLPYPAGIFMMEKRFLTYVTNNVEYIGTSDATISGSRNGHTPILIQNMLEKKGFEGFKKDVLQCIEVAEYAVGKIPGAWRNQNSITVVFPRPCDDIIQKWQLATDKGISHIVVMPHVTKEKIDAFVADLLDTLSD
jgi:histidine decarboxylase